MYHDRRNKETNVRRASHGHGTPKKRMSFSPTYVLGGEGGGANDKGSENSGLHG